MKTKILGLALVVCALSAPAGAAVFGDFDHLVHGRGGRALPAPEIDPASAMSALTMLAGGLVILRGRRSKK